MPSEPKPRDVGNGLVCASFAESGAWLSLATLDGEARFIEVTGLPDFEPAWRGDPAAVRRYRALMLDERHAFLALESGEAHVTTRQDARRDSRALVQQLVLRAPASRRPAGVALRFSGRLGPPAFAEITEVEEPPATDRPTRLEAREGVLAVHGEGPPLIVQAWLRRGAGDAQDRSDHRLGWRLLRRRRPTAVAWLDWPPGEDEVRLDIACAFEAPVPEPPAWLLPERRPSPQGVRSVGRERRPLRIPARLRAPLRRMTRGAAAYVRDCTALRVSGWERVILTDHRILPLSWTRDAYWQARLLLAVSARGGRGKDVGIVADHLRWLFLRCERPAGRWVRSHHADGRCKDRPLQADQQLYPLLELADYARATGRLPLLPEGEVWAPLVRAAWSAAEAAIDPASGLIATQENPADDEVGHPFLLSDQVLLWHVATRLAEASKTLALPRRPFTERAARVRAAVRQHFVVPGPLGHQWAYAADARGGFERSLDANDLPTALAPLWGFCRPSDRVWRATMRFAGHPDNATFVAGRLGGLGSRHTPGTWTLGDIQRWLAAGLMGEREEADGALARLVSVAFEDGLLPEAYDPEGSGRAVRHWFAWPAAALGTLVLDHAQVDR